MLFLVVVLFLVLVVECAIVLNYITLSEEEPRWWWRVWCGSATIGIYIFFVLILYLLFDLQVEYLTTLISYLTACALVSFLIALMASSLAIVCAFKFNLSIYSRVKLE
mmetsp:Transcript_26263/g.35051  ORF Transcript_26263/g.35051 Transcript_26263/m.35051 type:complete len:108 (-) Transcript_26263:26-349(-)